MEYDPPLPHYIDLKRLFKGNIERMNDNTSITAYDRDARGNRIVYFSGQDTPREFKASLNKHPEDWHYRNKEVTYRCNSSFYRYNEFNTVDWANSVVIFGCSNVQGQGLAEDETISEQLAQLLGRPVVNIGVGGSGMMFNLHNSLLFMENFPTPWAVVQHWPSMYRMHIFNDFVKTLGPWDVGDPFITAWSSDERNTQMHALFVDMISRKLWADRTRYVTITQCHFTGPAIKCDLIHRLDFARDNGHPGRRTAAAVAQRLAEQLR